MVNKPEYISKLENTEGIFSCLDFHKYDNNLMKYLDDKKFQRVYEKGVVSSKGKAAWEEVIYQTKQNFYFHVVCHRNNLDEQYSLTIYYKPTQFNELVFLTTQILKPFKDGTDNNGTTKTEN